MLLDEGGAVDGGKRGRARWRRRRDRRRYGRGWVGIEVGLASRRIPIDTTVSCVARREKDVRMLRWLMLLQRGGRKRPEVVRVEGRHVAVRRLGVMREVAGRGGRSKPVRTRRSERISAEILDMRVVCVSRLGRLVLLVLVLLPVDHLRRRRWVVSLLLLLMLLVGERVRVEAANRVQVVRLLGVRVDRHRLGHPKAAILRCDAAVERVRIFPSSRSDTDRRLQAGLIAGS